MVDFAKKIRKSCAEHLEPGEEVIAGVFGQPPGAIRRQMATGIGGLAGALIADKTAKGTTVERPDEGIVVDIPEGKAVLGLTDRRLLVFGHSAMTGKPKGLNAAVPLGHIESVTLDQGKFAGRLVVTFVDGTHIDFDVVKTVKPQPFVDAFHQVTGR